MKNTRIYIVLLCLFLFMTYFQGLAQAPEDSTLKVRKPTSEDLYDLDCKMAEKLTALKYDPSTKQLKASYAYDKAGLVAKVVLYYQGNRIIRLEKRIYDPNNTQMSYSMYSFDEKNGCFSNAQWNVKDSKTCTLTLSEYGLINFGSDMKLIEMDADDMQKYIQESKDSLDAVMGHFNSFKYTFEIK